MTKILEIHLRTSLLKNPWFGILGNDQKYFAANWRRETCKCLKMKLISAVCSRLLPPAQGLSATCITKKMIMLWIPDLILESISNEIKTYTHMTYHTICKYYYETLNTCTHQNNALQKKTVIGTTRTIITKIFLSWCISSLVESYFDLPSAK